MIGTTKQPDRTPNQRRAPKGSIADNTPWGLVGPLCCSALASQAGMAGARPYANPDSSSNTLAAPEQNPTLTKGPFRKSSLVASPTVLAHQLESDALSPRHPETHRNPDRRSRRKPKRKCQPSDGVKGLQARSEASPVAAGKQRLATSTGVSWMPGFH